MKLGILVNDVATERPGYTTTRLAVAATGRGHEVWLVGVSDLAYDPDESVHARARTVPKAQYRSGESYLTDLRSSRARVERSELQPNFAQGLPYHTAVQFIDLAESQRDLLVKYGLRKQRAQIRESERANSSEPP